MKNLIWVAVATVLLWRGGAAEIQLPPETAAFKQAPGAELANGQCLVCHSVEYVSTQPPLPRTFWKSSVQKMQQKYGAQISEEQVEPLVDYLTSNYGVATNSAAVAASSIPAGTSSEPANLSDGPKLAAKYGCLGCHATATKIVGPAYKDIAGKYKADPDATTKINQQIHQGGSGKWGPMLMPPFPQVTASESKVLAEWILALK